MAEKQLTTTQQNKQWEMKIVDAELWEEKLKEKNNKFCSFSNFCQKPIYLENIAGVHQTNQCTFEWTVTINIPVNPIKIHALQFLFKNNIRLQELEDFWSNLAVYKYYFSTYQEMKKYTAEFILELDGCNFFREPTSKICFNDWVTFGIKKNDILMFLSKYNFVNKLIKIINQPHNSISKIYDILLINEIVNDANRNQENKRCNIVEKYSSKIYTNIKTEYTCSFLEILNEENASEFISIDKDQLLKQIKNEYIKIRNYNFDGIFSQILNFFKTNKFNNLMNAETHELLNAALSKQIVPNTFITKLFDLVEFCNCNNPYLIPLIYDDDIIELKNKYIQFFDQLNKSANIFYVQDAKSQIKDYFDICKEAKTLKDFAYYVDAIAKLLDIPNFNSHDFELLHNCYNRTFWSENDREKRAPFHQWKLAAAFIMKNKQTLINDQNRDEIKLFATNFLTQLGGLHVRKTN